MKRFLYTVSKGEGKDQFLIRNKFIIYDEIKDYKKEKL
jgi:hypothetical protein